MTIRRSCEPYVKPKHKRRAAPFDDAPPPNLKLMSNSERGKYYRRRRKFYGTHLEECVANLREEIAALTVSHQIQQELAVSQRRTPLGAAAHIVNEYCLLFSHGTPVRLSVNENDASVSLVAHASNAQRGFLNAVMNDNVRFGEFVGVELLLGQWERYSLYHAAIEWNMTSLSVVQLNDDNQFDEGSFVISITADLRVRYSRRTIEEVFPHLIGDEALVQSLIGLEVTYPSINHFHFNKDRKIEWYAPEADFVGALMNALNDPMLVARIMGSALITKNHMIGDESDGRQLVTRVEEINSQIDCPSFEKDDDVAVVSDEEVSPESPCRAHQMSLSYILGN
ncbi:hypothetical protein DVH05_028431 [Phytophthora capsici]|nr:hypothetical protein DVH05_028431 [Phytophthora capsici]|eukprot:jgi/Phyca11/107576/e_gw1.14.697.1